MTEMRLKGLTPFIVNYHNWKISDQHVCRLRCYKLLHRISVSSKQQWHANYKWYFLSASENIAFLDAGWQNCMCSEWGKNRNSEVLLYWLQKTSRWIVTTEGNRVRWSVPKVKSSRQSRYFNRHSPTTEKLVSNHVGGNQASVMLSIILPKYKPALLDFSGTKK